MKLKFEAIGEHITKHFPKICQRRVCWSICDRLDLKRFILNPADMFASFSDNAKSRHATSGSSSRTHSDRTTPVGATRDVPWCNSVCKFDHCRQEDAAAD